MTIEFRRIGLWGRFYDEKVAHPAVQITSHLLERGAQVFVAGDPSDVLKDATPVDPEALADSIDLLIAIGGDGNFLRATRRVAGKDVPLIGVNRGRLGFLTDVSPEEMLTALDSIIEGDYLAEDRLLLEAGIAHAGPGSKMYALHDVVLQKGDSGRILDFVTTVDGSYVNSHGGDGLIVATPTGSTAYALSCNGPIIRPDLNALVMVPICPHTLSDRPLVIAGSSHIEVRLNAATADPATVTCDGEELGHLGEGQTLEIRAADESVTLLHPRDYNYYDLLRSKLNWGRANRTG
jgi:NAD+ kinase